MDEVLIDTLTKFFPKKLSYLESHYQKYDTLPSVMIVNSFFDLFAEIAYVLGVKL